MINYLALDCLMIGNYAEYEERLDKRKGRDEGEEGLGEDPEEPDCYLAKD